MPPIGYPGNSVSKAARAKAGGGFESAIEVPDGFSGGNSQLGWSSNEQLAQGAIVNITTDGTFNFGLRQNAEPIFHMEGAKAWVRGVGEVTLLEASRSDGDTLSDAQEASPNTSVWGQLDNVTAKRTGLPGRSDFAYEGSQAYIGLLEYDDYDVGEKYDRVTKVTNKGYIGWKNYFSADCSQTYIVNYDPSTASGTFDAGIDEFGIGEQIVIDNGVDTWTANLIKVGTDPDSGTEAIFFEIVSGGSLSTAEHYGATFTGQSSGAQVTARLEGDPNALKTNVSNLKLGRFVTRLSNDRPSSPDVSLGLTVVGSGQHIIDLSDAATTGNHRPDSDVVLPTPRTWETLAYEIDGSQSLPVFRTRKNGNAFEYVTKSADLSLAPINSENVTNGFLVNTIAFDSPSVAEAGLNKVARDFHKDDELARVMIGNNPSLSSCSILEHTRSTDWASTSATVAVNYGDIPAGNNAYAFVFNDSGECVNPSQGLDIGSAT